MITDPKNAAEKLAALIPNPADGIAKASEAKIVAPEPDASVAITTSPGGPAPPLHTLEEPPAPKKAPTRRRKTATASRTNAAASAAAKKELRKMLPASHRVHVYKRNRHGQMAFVSDYSANDLAAQGSMERFLKEYVVPDYDYGEFSLYMQEPGKDLQPIGSVTIEAPMSHKKKGGGSETRELLELWMKQQESAKASAASQKDPLEQMRETLTFLRGMTGESKEKSSMDPMMLMMMMQMQKRDAPPAGPDPIMLKLIDRIDRMEDSYGAAAMLPPPPPPPPPPAANPMESFASMMAVLAEQQRSSNQMLVEAIRARPAERDPVADIARLTQLTGATDDRMTTKDFLTMLPSLKTMIAPDPGKSSLSEALDTMRHVKILEREFGGNSQENIAASSFWDFLRDFITSDAGTKVAEAITAQQGRDKVDARHDQRRLAAENAVAEEPPQEGIVVPESFRQKHAVEINTAVTAPERLKALITGLQHLGMHPEFRPYVAKVFGLAKPNRRLECLDFLAQFLEALIESGALEVEACKQAIEDLDTYWALVRQQLGMEDIPEVFPEGYVDTKAEAASSGEYELEEEDEVDPPRKSYRDSARDMEPTHPEIRSQQGLEEQVPAEMETAAAS